MVKEVTFTRKKTVIEILKEAQVNLDSTKVEMSAMGDDIVFRFLEDAPTSEVQKLKAYFEKKGFKTLSEV